MARNVKEDTPWRRAPSGEEAQELKASRGDQGSEEFFFVACPEMKNPLSYIYKMLKEGNLAQTSASEDVATKMNNTTTWQERLALFLMQTLKFLASFMGKVGYVLELIGNIFHANGGLIKTTFKLLHGALFFFKKGTLVVPEKDSANFLTIIGLMDPRKDLLALDPPSLSTSVLNAEKSTADGRDTKISEAALSGIVPGDRRTADLMLMAAKFAYENEAVVRDVVTNSWQMNFVNSYNCWNEYQQRFNRQVFIFTDKARDANAIVVAWRGTAPFSPEDWATDVDFSWYDLQGGLGRVHVGFLESLGLGDRHDMATFFHLRNAVVKQDVSKPSDDHKVQARELQRSDSESGIPISPSPPASGLPQEVIDAPEKILAYDDITKVVKGLLKDNPNAKLFITGHSLGAALGMLYTGMLYYFGENAVADRISCVYAFGQPRVGDETFSQFMLETLTVERYFRVVFHNDIIPRLPFDHSLFGFKHWGLCYYFSSFYSVQTLPEPPNPNYFSISNFLCKYLSAMSDLISSIFIKYTAGPTYKESSTSFWFRVLALFLPGFGAHNVVNYCNSVRLGNPMPLVPNVN